MTRVLYLQLCSKACHLAAIVYYKQSPHLKNYEIYSTVGFVYLNFFIRAKTTCDNLLPLPLASHFPSLSHLNKRVKLKVKGKLLYFFGRRFNQWMDKTTISEYSWGREGEIPIQIHFKRKRLLPNWYLKGNDIKSSIWLLFLLIVHLWELLLEVPELHLLPQQYERNGMGGVTASSFIGCFNFKYSLFLIFTFYFLRIIKFIILV